MSEMSKILKAVQNLAYHYNEVKKVGIPPMRFDCIEASEILVCMYYLMMDLGIESGCKCDNEILAREICGPKGVI